MEGTHKIINERTEFVYQMPYIEGIKPKGILVLFHGCQHSALDFWPKSENCMNCFGLPIEKKLVNLALENNYFVLAISSSSDTHKCWVDEDISYVTEVFEYIFNIFIKKYHGRKMIESTPFHLLGASSGGSFVAKLSSSKIMINDKQLKISSICVQISNMHHYWQKNNLPSPTLFIHMGIMDRNTKLQIMNTLTLLRNHNVDASELVCSPKSIYPTYFSDYQVLSIVDSNKLYDNFVDNRILSDKNGAFYLLNDPRKSNWRDECSKIIPHIVPEVDSLIQDKSGISELMNVAYGLHEFTDEYFDQTLKWFESHQSIS
jgi:hypothetical protein